MNILFNFCDTVGLLSIINTFNCMFFRRYRTTTIYFIYGLKGVNLPCTTLTHDLGVIYVHRFHSIHNYLVHIARKLSFIHCKPINLTLLYNTSIVIRLDIGQFNNVENRLFSCYADFSFNVFYSPHDYCLIIQVFGISS